MGFRIAFLDILSQVRRCNLVQNFYTAVRINILVRKFKDSCFLAFFGNVERSTKFFDSVETLEFVYGECLTGANLGTENSESGRIAGISEMIGLPSTSCEDQFFVLVEELEVA